MPAQLICFTLDSQPPLLSHRNHLANDIAVTGFIKPEIVKFWQAPSSHAGFGGIIQTHALANRAAQRVDSMRQH